MNELIQQYLRIHFKSNQIRLQTNRKKDRSYRIWSKYMEFLRETIII